MNLKENKGITLIALIITVIILLILAGTAISIAVNGDDIFSKATTAREQWNTAVADEKVNYQNIVSMMDDYFASQKNPTLVSQITSEDYGKTINYSVNVNGTDLTNWKVFLNDGTNVYIIYGDYLEASLVPSAAIFARDTSTNKYCIWGAIVSGDMAAQFVNALLDKNLWKDFASGIEGATAIGGPTLKQLNDSLERSASTYQNVPENTLYIPSFETVEGCQGYWLAEYHKQMDSTYVTYVKNDRSIWRSEEACQHIFSVRPLICLPGTATGTIGTNVTIDI